MKNSSTNGALKILVVDDDPNELRSLVIGFGLENFKADGAKTGKIALKMLAEKDYSVALIDLMMPDMNGLQLARVVRSVFPSITTILMSAYHLSPIQLARADAGVSGFVPKPFRFDTLVEFILAKAEFRKTKEETGSMTSLHERGLYCPVEIPEVMSDHESKIP